MADWQQYIKQEDGTLALVGNDAQRITVFLGGDGASDELTAGRGIYEEHPFASYFGALGFLQKNYSHVPLATVKLLGDVYDEYEMDLQTPSEAVTGFRSLTVEGATGAEKLHCKGIFPVASPIVLQNMKLASDYAIAIAGGVDNAILYVNTDVHFDIAAVGIMMINGSRMMSNNGFSVNFTDSSLFLIADGGSSVLCNGVVTMNGKCNVLFNASYDCIINMKQVTASGSVEGVECLLENYSRYYRPDVGSWGATEGNADATSIIA